jgi:hypothetical protein
MTNFNQPQCERCWVVERSDSEGWCPVPVRLKGGAPDSPPRCAWCGYPTWCGIWVRAHPDDVPFPTLDIDEKHFGEEVPSRG